MLYEKQPEKLLVGIADVGEAYNLAQPTLAIPPANDVEKVKQFAADLSASSLISGSKGVIKQAELLIEKGYQLRPAPSVEEIKSKLKDAEDAGLILVYDDDFGTVRSQIAQEIADLGRGQ